MLRIVVTSVLFLVSTAGMAQNRITLLNGKEIEAKDVKVEDFKIIYHTVEKNKLKKMSSDGVFSIQYADGKEQVIYEKDPLEQDAISVDDMRIFISGEQAADAYYRNHVNKAAAAALGVAGGLLLNFYGVTVPALYATIVGSVAPSKQPGASEAMKDNLIYRDGYDRRATDRKIKNALIFGYSGFAVSFAAFVIFLK